MTLSGTPTGIATTTTGNTAFGDFAIGQVKGSRLSVPTLVQSASFYRGPTDRPNLTVPFASTNSPGDLIVVAVTIGATASDHQVSVTDTQGNTYYPATPLVTWRTDGGGTSAQLFYAANVRAGSNSVTMTELDPGGGGALGGVGNAFNGLAIHEYSGMALASPLDVSSVSNGITGPGPTTISSGTAMTSVNGDLIFGYGNNYGGALSAGSGFTIRQTPDGVSEDMVQTTAGPVAATMGESADNSPYAMLMAAFRPEVASQGLEMPVLTNMVVNEQGLLSITNAAAELNATIRTTQTTLFTYANRSALVGDGWNFIATNSTGGPRNTETTSGAGVIQYAQSNGTYGTVMRIPVDLGDLLGSLNSTTNTLFRSLSTNWLSMRMSLSLAPTVNYQQVHLGVYQNDDNYVEAGFTWNSGIGGEAVTLDAETNGVDQHYYTDVYWYSGGPDAPPITNIFLRLDRNQITGNVDGFCSLDGVAWPFIGDFGQALTNARLCIWAGGSQVPYTIGLPVCDIRELDLDTANPPPAITYQLLSPSAGATINSRGVITWTPSVAQGLATYVLTTVATDAAASLNATNSFSVTVRAPVTVTGITANTRVYDGTTNATLNTGGAMLVGVAAGDVGNVTLVTSGASGSFTNTTVGTNMTVAVSGLTLGGSAASKYSLTQPTTTASITNLVVTPSVTVNGKTYDGTTTGVIGGGSLSGAVAGDAVSLKTSGATATFASRNAGTGVGVHVTGLALSGAKAGNYLLSATTANTTTNIVVLGITVSAVTDSRGYDGTANSTGTPTITTGSLGSGDSAAWTQSFDSPNTGARTLTPAGTVTDGNGGANYNVSYQTASGTITNRPLTVTADAKTKVYGSSDPALTYQITSGSLASGDSLSGSLTRAAGTNAGNYAILQGSLTAGANYTLTYAGANLSITAEPLTVTADAKTKVYGASDPSLTSQITSGALVGGDSLSGSLTRVVGTNVGAYAIQQGTLAVGGNYTLTYVGANVTITAAPLTATADAKTEVYGAGDPALTYQVTSGSLVGGDSLNGSLTRVAGTNVGNYAIQQGTLAVGGNYTLTYVGANLTISAAPLTVTADAKTKVYGASDPALTYQVTSGVLVGGDSLSGSQTRVTGTNVGSYAIQQGTLAASANYALTYVGANLSITAAPLTATADAKTEVYGAGDPALTYQITSGSLVGGDSLNGSLTRVAGTKVGNYAIQQGTLVASANYTLTYVGANLTITAAPLTATADAKTKLYGASDPALTYLITSGSLVGGDGLSGSLTRVAGTNVGSYAIQQGTLAASVNYTLTYVGANLTITAALADGHGRCQDQGVWRE